MRTTPGAVAATLFFCGASVPTGTSFSSALITSTPPHTHVAGSRRMRRRLALRRVFGSPTSSMDMLPGTAPALTAHTEGELQDLTRRELQAMCKKLRLRAVGKTSELIDRLQQQQLPTSTSTSSHAARDDPSTLTTDEGSVPSPSPPIPPSGGTHQATGTVPLASAPSDEVGESLLLPPISGEEVDNSNSSSSSSSDRQLESFRGLFDELSHEQWAQVEQLGHLLAEWNGRVNLISRKDIGNVMLRHVMPCLAMAKALKLENGVDVLDVGTGGGLPGLPLAICYPNVQFTLVDGTGKKIMAVQDMVERLGLRNVRAFHIRAEEIREPFDYIMGRAVTRLPKFVGFIENNLKRNKPRSGEPTGKEPLLKRGLLYMRGEVSEEELAELGAQPSTVISLQRILEPGVGTDQSEGGVQDRGYSSVFHFTSESLWNRTPVSASAVDDVGDRE